MLPTSQSVKIFVGKFFQIKIVLGWNFGDFRNQSRKELETLTFIEGEAFVVKAVVVSLSEEPFIQKGKL